MSDAVTFDQARRDQRLAQLLAELTDQLHHGKQPDLEQATREHPELARELRELWGTVVLTEALVQPGETISPSPLSIGETGVNDLEDYDILETIGQGGQGVVYKARQRSLNRLVALKTIRSDRTDEESRARFRAEAKAVARLDHANIVPVFDVGESESRLYFSMKYIDGSTLAKLLANGPLPPREAARLIVAIADAVHYAHENGILHRDLKPSNILLASGGRKPSDELVGAPSGGSRPPLAGVIPFVTDFGLAKTISGEELQRSLAGDNLTATNHILGTPSYMSPEQVDRRRGQLGRASDVYSLGAILYEMLTGRPPFLAADPVDIFLRILDQDPVTPRRLNPSVDRDLEMICLKCLQKPAELRYATAGQLADDLRKFLNYERPSVWSGSFINIISTAFRETHHAPVLENWGTLWMWHSLQIFLLCVLTNAMAWAGVKSPLPYLALWSIGLCVWGAIFWNLRKRGGPVQFIERQIAHVWGAAIIGTIGIFIIEVLLGLPPLTLSPLLGIIAGMTFVVKAGMLSGLFYFQAAALFLVAIPMALFPQVGPLLFGIVSAGCFLIPGWKYSRQRKMNDQ
jgi:serine/threonine-protein kinase